MAAIVSVPLATPRIRHSAAISERVAGPLQWAVEAIYAVCDGVDLPYPWAES